MIEMHCTVTGQVQNVRYRDFVQVSATQMGLTGWVKNESDGSVSVCVQGMPEVLKDMVEYLNEGSLLSKVESVSVEWRSIKKPLLDFSVIID